MAKQPYTFGRVLQMIALVILIAAIGFVSANLYLQYEAQKDYQARGGGMFYKK